MPSLSATLGAPLHQDSGDPSSTPTGYEATITAIGAATCTIVVPGYSEIHDFTNVPFVAPNGTPQVGDVGVAFFVDDRHPILLLPGVLGATTVWAHGAAGDGTNESVKVQAAIDAVYATGKPGTVEFAPGKTYLVNLVLKPRVTLRLNGATLKAPNGSNADVVKGLNFATLTGKTKATGDYALGTFDAVIRDGYIDGNKANNSSGYGVRWWGRGNQLVNVEINNCKSGGLWEEFTDVDDFSDVTQRLESGHRHLRITGCDGHGWVQRGPHDAYADDVVIYSNTGWAVRVETNEPSYNGGLTVTKLNVFLCDQGGVYAEGAFFGDNCQLTGAGTGVAGLEWSAGSGGGRATGIIGADTGVIVRGDNKLVDATIVNCTADAIVIDGAHNYTINAVGSANENCVDVVSDSIGIVRARFDIPAGKTLKTGAAWGQKTSVDLYGSGAGGPLQDFQLPSSVVKASGWSPVLPASNGTMVVCETESLRTVRGRMDTAGNVLEGSGFSVNKTGTGVYVITYSSAFPSAATPAVTLGSALPAGRVGTSTVTTTGFTVSTYNSAGAAADGNFGFIAMGSL